MDIEGLGILLRLLLAHLLADFVFQTNDMVKGKQKGLKSKHFWRHLLIVGLLTYLCLADWTNWWVPLLIVAFHAVIDLFKISFKKDNVWLYIGDQLLHFLSIILVWVMMANPHLTPLFQNIGEYLFADITLLVIIAYLIVSLPVGFLIGYLTKPWQDEVKEKGKKSLKNAGKWIGVIERILILTFILAKQWEAIGFLLAAKSVFRFGELKEAKEQKKTEYILIGTLLSFAFALIIGIITQFMIRL
tara:strand:- start:546 stop:1280 length:735 start_codon:yes stop_codon:yes gene_type:complete